MTWTTRPRSNLGQLAAITKGVGPLVVMLHGVGLRSEAWNPLIDAMSVGYRVVALDMLGHGETPAPDTDVYLKDYCLAISDILNEPCILVGHSMGARIALDLASRMPDKVMGVVALNAIFERGPQAATAIQSRASALIDDSVSDPTPTLSRWFGDESSAERSACEYWLRSVNPRGYRLAYQAFAAQDGPPREELAALTCPALFMTGADEPNSTPEMSLEMAEIAPHGMAQIVENAAHMMPMTHVNQVTDALLNFANSVWPTNGQSSQHLSKGT